jgi:hypothetical protein
MDNINQVQNRDQNCYYNEVEQNNIECVMDR